MPLERGDRYEDPLDEALKTQEFGEVTGGGTMQKVSGEIEFIDLEMRLSDLVRGIPFVISKLENWGAPKGSILRVYQKDMTEEIPFGRAEGIGIYLDGVNLPKDVYQNSDVNHVISECNKRLSGRGEMQSFWEGPQETALYFYGQSASEMKRLMHDFIESYPLCQNAREVTLAPRPTGA